MQRENTFEFLVHENVYITGATIYTYIVLAAWSINVLLLQFYGTFLPFWQSVFMGFISGIFTIPFAIIITILKIIGIL